MRIGPYEVERELGRGGMGVVWQARHVDLDRRVALKMILEPEPELVARFEAEARALARVRHPNVVGVHDVGVANGRPWLALELVDGEPLEDRLRTQGPLPIDEALRILRELTLAVDAAHAEGVLHRDLKPDNVLIDRTGRVRLTDFGLARGGAGDEGERSRLTRTGETLGTPGYMPPEQVEEARAADVRADVYGLGAVLYALIGGQPPFRRASVINTLIAVLQEPPTPLRELRPDVPPAVEALVARCLAKAPDDRFPTAAALADALDDLDEARGDEPAQGKLVAIGLGVLALILVGALLGLGISRATRATAAASPAPTASPTPPAASPGAPLEPAAPSPTPDAAPTLAPPQAAAAAYEAGRRALRARDFTAFERATRRLLALQRGDLVVLLVQQPAAAAHPAGAERLSALEAEAGRALGRAPIDMLNRYVFQTRAGPTAAQRAQLERDAAHDPAARRVLLYWRGIDALKRRDLKACARTAQELIDAYPHLPDGHALKSQAVFGLKRPAEAYELLRRALDLAKLREEHEFICAWAGAAATGKLRAQRWKDAEALANEALAHTPPPAEDSDSWRRSRWNALRARSHALWRQGYLPRALLDLEQLLLDPSRPKGQDVPLLRQAVTIHVQLQQDDRALEKVERWRRLAPDQPEPHARRGAILAVQGRRAEARRSLDRSIALRPTVEAYVWRAKIRCEGDAPDLAGARADLEASLRLSPTHVGALLAASGVAERQGRFADALRLLERATRAQPNDPRVRRQQARRSALRARSR